MRTPDDDSRPVCGGFLLAVAWLLAALLFAALPVVAGVVVVCCVPGLGGAREGFTVPAIAGILLVIVAAGVVIGERPVRLMRVLLPGRPWLQRACAEVLVFTFLAAALHVVLASAIGSIVAAAVGCAGYRALEPLLQRATP